MFKPKCFFVNLVRAYSSLLPSSWWLNILVGVTMLLLGVDVGGGTSTIGGRLRGGGVGVDPSPLSKDCKNDGDWLSPLGGVPTGGVTAAAIIVEVGGAAKWAGNFACCCLRAGNMLCKSMALMWGLLSRLLLFLRTCDEVRIHNKRAWPVDGGVTAWTTVK